MEFIGIPTINWIFAILMLIIGNFICISICYMIIRVILYIKKLIITLALAIGYRMSKIRKKKTIPNLFIII